MEAAASQGHTEVVALFVDRGANLNAQNKVRNGAYIYFYHFRFRFRLFFKIIFLKKILKDLECHASQLSKVIVFV